MNYDLLFNLLFSFFIIVLGIIMLMYEYRVKFGLGNQHGCKQKVNPRNYKLYPIPKKQK